MTFWSHLLDHNYIHGRISIHKYKLYGIDSWVESFPQRLSTYNTSILNKLNTAKFRWKVQPISRLCNIVNINGTNRNEALHDIDTIDRLSGIEILDRSISTEHLKDLDRFPPVYTSYFYLSLLVLLNRSNSYCRRWLLVIRSVCESFSSNAQIDDFTLNQSLWYWVELATK